jgi:hypothetical protein
MSYNLHMHQQNAIRTEETSEDLYARIWAHEQAGKECERELIILKARYDGLRLLSVHIALAGVGGWCLAAALGGFIKGWW